MRIVLEIANNDVEGVRSAIEQVLHDHKEYVNFKSRCSCGQDKHALDCTKWILDALDEAKETM